MTQIHDETASRITMPGAPDLPGFVFRHFRGSADFEGMVATNMAARGAYGILENVTVESIAVQYANLTNSDVDRDLVIVEQAGAIVGYARVEWSDQQDGSRAYDTICLLRPELEDRGIGGALLGWQESRLREIAAEHENVDRPRWLQVSGWDANERHRRLLLRRGYEPVRRGYEMVRPDLADLPDPPLPDGLAIRPVTREDFRALWEADVEIFRDHWGETDVSEAAWIRFRDEPMYDPDLFVVAFDGDEIAGMVLNVLEPAEPPRTTEVRGLLDSVGIRQPWRRRGLARALIAHSLRLLRDKGATSAFLGVDGENPNQAMTLYERMGFRIASSTTTYRKAIDDQEEDHR